MTVTTDSAKPTDEEYNKILKLMIDEPTNYNKIMYSTASEGHMNIVKLMLEKGANNYNSAMEPVAFRGHMDIVKLMIEKGANNYNSAMYNAAKGGHMDIVKLMLEKGANGYSGTMNFAALRGYMDIVTLMLEKGANDYNGAMRYAASGGHMDIVKLMLEKGADDYNLAMSYAASGGHTDIVKLMLEKGANKYNSAMSNAVERGHIDIVKLMLEKGADNYNWEMSNAAANGHIAIVKLMLERGANSYNGAINSAASEGHMDIVKLMLEKGANDYDGAMNSAALGGHIDIVKLMLEKGADNYDLAMGSAAEQRHTDIVTLLNTHQKNKIEATKKPEKKTVTDSISGFPVLYIKPSCHNEEQNTESNSKNDEAAKEFCKIARDRVNVSSIELITHHQRCLNIIESIPANDVPTETWKSALQCLIKNENDDCRLLISMSCVYNAYISTNNACEILLRQFADYLAKLIAMDPFNVEFIKLYSQYNDLLSQEHRFPPNNNLSNYMDILKAQYKHILSNLPLETGKPCQGKPCSGRQPEAGLSPCRGNDSSVIKSYFAIALDCFRLIW